MLKKVVYILILCLGVTNSFTQTVPPNIQAMLSCQNGVPFQTVNLTGNPAGTVSLNVANRANLCCSAPNNNDCKVIEFILDPNSSGVMLNPSGATALGNLNMWINDCSQPYTFGNPICLTGQGPHYFVFCKSGGNEYNVTLTSLPAPSVSGNISSSTSCGGLISTTGLTQSTITWNSISPGTLGQHNNLLYNPQQTINGVAFQGFTNQDTIVVVPQLNSPSQIQYQVCGQVTNVCGAINNFCDTVTVTVIQPLSASITPTTPILCSTPTITLTAQTNGGSGNFQYLWTGPGVTGAITQSVSISSLGDYSVVVTDNLACYTASANTSVTGCCDVTTDPTDPTCYN
jgi:hypothetical protein